MVAFVHETVLLRETMQAISPRPGGVYADATAGGGGHSEALLEASSPTGKVIAVDRDPAAVHATRHRLARFGSRVTVVHGEYADLQPIVRRAGTEQVQGVVADLGVSSPQLEDAERGFGFSAGGPLDMRMDTSKGETAAELLARMDEKALADILYGLGQERRSRAIARSVRRAVQQGQMSTTEDLRRAVVRVLGPQKRGGVNPATRTFLALRIALNRELEQLEALVGVLPDLLADRGVAAIISFHSLEDRIVKRAFRSDERLEPLSKKPLVPTEPECVRNPRARSAKLRAARRAGRPHRDEEEVS